MNIFWAVLSIVVGVLVAALLDYFNVFTPHINALLGVVAGFLFYFGWGRGNQLL